MAPTDWPGPPPNCGGGLKEMVGLRSAEDGRRLPARGSNLHLAKVKGGEETVSLAPPLGVC